MPCSTTHPCSEELVAVLPCPLRLRGILGQVSSPLPGSCSPIPQMAVVQHAGDEAQSSMENEVNEGSPLVAPLNLAQTGAAGCPAF